MRHLFNRITTRLGIILFILLLILIVTQISQHIFAQRISLTAKAELRAVEQRSRLLLIAYYVNEYLKASEHQNYVRYQLNYHIEHFQKSNDLIVQDGDWELPDSMIDLMAEIRSHWDQVLHPILKSKTYSDAVYENYSKYAPVNMIIYDRLIHRLNNEKLRQKQLERFNSIIFNILAVLTMISAAFYIHTMISRPLIQLSRSLTGFKIGNTVDTINTSNIDELEVINNAFCEMASQINRDSEVLESLNNFALTINKSTSINDIMDEIIFNGTQLIGSDATCLFICPDKNSCRTDSLGIDNEFITALKENVPNIFGGNKKSNKPVIVQQTMLSESERKVGYKNAIHIQFILNDNASASLHFYHFNEITITDKELKTLNVIANISEVAMKNLLKLISIREEAMTDPLTRVNNRRAFEEKYDSMITKSVMNNTSFSVLIIDIDRFKQFNDNYGHKTGDAILKLVAARLKQESRGMDIVARIGGEEFVVVFNNLDYSSTWQSAERIRQAIANEPFHIDGTKLNISASIGFACFPADSQDRQMLIDYADIALYESKSNGRNRVTSYSELASELSNKKSI